MNNKKRFFLFFLLTLAVLAAGISIALFTRVPIPSGFSEQLATYTRNKPDAQITIAVISEDGTEIQAYGHDGHIIPVPDRSYEIGTVTQTFTGAITAKAVTEGRLSPNETIASLLPLARAAYSPTVYELLTHSSAYSDYTPGASSLRSLLGRNPYSCIDINAVVSGINAFKLSYEPPYLYSPSPFGAAAMGAVISEVYDVDFYSILTIFAQTELGLSHTYVSLGRTVPNGWTWSTADAFLASCGLTSTIGDMVAYAKLFLTPEIDYIRLASEPFYEVNADTSLGFYWTLTNEDHLLSASGETAHYAAQLLIDRENHLAIVILSNYSNDRYGSVASLASALRAERLSASTVSVPSEAEETPAI